jgi:hypothetical protein
VAKNYKWCDHELELIEEGNSDHGYALGLAYGRIELAPILEDYGIEEGCEDEHEWEALLLDDENTVVAQADGPSRAKAMKGLVKKIKSKLEVLACADEELSG